MDITRGSLDKISRPASSSRAHRNCRSLTRSMELLTPEPCVPKVESSITLTGSHQRGSLEDGCPEENKEHMSNSDSGDNSSETQTLQFCEPPEGKPCNAKAGLFLSTANSSNLEYSEETDVDPQIQAAIKRMNKLDTILAKKQFKERTIKKQGKQMRAKLWEELQSLRTTGSHEEIENTNHFLALMSSWQDTADPSHAKEDEIHTSVFHTQISPEDYDCCKTQHNQDYPRELETNEFLNQAEKMHSKSNNSQDFIKKNIELAKDAGNQIVMLEGERKRLIELLKDIEDGTELQGLEESLVYANRSMEAVPGEKVLRDNKEQRDQQNRLKEIDHQLKSLGRNLTEEQTRLSEEQLKTLLEECMQPQRTISNVTMPKSQESLSLGLSPPCYTSQDSALHSKSTLSKMLVEDHIVGMLMAQEKAGLEDKSLCVNAESEITGYYISKTLADSHLSKDSLAQTEELDDLEGLQKMRDKRITEHYFMSRALNTKRLKKPSFLDEPLYCISMNNERSTEADILSIPLQTKGGETLNNPLE
ncbi:fibrous sheath-interacting protein 1 isoform X2 [Colius striatus]|uniref:fibrous sheath-interacting protein 1 isoform X2 n=1 Tax=Colius striatus TaxID=57412 RepID=UPI002B1E0759|nr:fibrous sheath-interacting protein 1 isoform X2 [Colius striatus]